MTQLYDEFGWPLSPLEALAALRRHPRPRQKDEEEVPLDVTLVKEDSNE